MPTALYVRSLAPGSTIAMTLIGRLPKVARFSFSVNHHPTQPSRLRCSFSSCTTTAESDHRLIQRLQTLADSEDPNTTDKLVSVTTHPSPANPNFQIRAWELAADSELFRADPYLIPTRVRGLFTTNSEGKERVVARGHDKVFWFGERPWISWNTLRRFTDPPYDVTLKVDGALILIAALSPDKLLVTSRKSFTRDTRFPTHAQKGEEWLLKQLKSKGKTSEQLAAELWAKKWTAVAELCDDRYQEHVLSHSKEETGLTLHGLNACVASRFLTQPPSVVAEFANEWGFIPTPYKTFESIDLVRHFIEKVARTGSWKGSPVEGFVVRTRVTERPPSPGRAPRNVLVLNAPPYRPGSNVFVKIRFRKPYVMYRHWRGITRLLLDAEDVTTVEIPKKYLKDEQSVRYYNWAVSEIAKCRHLFDGFARQRGIIGARERFLASENGQSTSIFARPAIIVPVGSAVFRQMNTAIGIALNHIFGFQPIQDDRWRLPLDNPKNHILREVGIYGVVVTDRLLFSLPDPVLASSTKPPITSIALSWPEVSVREDYDGDSSSHRIATLERCVVEDRGLEGPDHVEGIDHVIKMNSLDRLESNIARAVKGCVKILGLTMPTEGRIQEGIKLAESHYTNSQRPRLLSGHFEEKTTRKRHYCSMIPRQLDAKALTSPFVEHLDTVTGKEGTAIRAIWNSLRDSNGFIPKPHITIAYQDDFCFSLSLAALPDSPGREGVHFQFRFSHLVTNQRVLVLVVDNFQIVEQKGKYEGRVVKALLDDSLRDEMHMTIGAAPGVEAAEAGELICNWRKGTAQDVDAVELKRKLTVRGVFSVARPDTVPHNAA